MGDLNAKVGNGRVGNTVGPFGLGTKNDRGERFVEFCQENDLVIGNTWFKQHPRRLWRWEMPGDRAKNQIYYICISQRYRNGLLSTITYPGADCGTDHVPVVATLRMKLKKLKKPQCKENFDRGLLSSKNEFTEKYQKFVEQNREKILTIKESLSLFKAFSGTITKALNDYIPKHNKKEQKTWITEDIKELFDKRRKAKGTNEYP